MLVSGDEEVRGAVTRLIASKARTPTSAEIAQALGRGADEIDAALRRLADAHALLLHPNSTRVWVAHPFALAPGGCWVQTAKHGYWANCVYCAFGIAAALKCQATVTTRLGGEGDTVRYEVGPAGVRSDGVFHLSTPVRHWWDNVIYACASFQPFRNEAEVDAWCERHAFPKGAVMPMDQLWRFASEWYGSYVDQPWRKRSADEVRAVFARHGLTGDFWDV